MKSLIQPLAIISMIPISFIGVFLTFYLFDINFDQGGFASFILLSGLVVNAGLYIINDFNNLRKKYPGRKPFNLYLKAYNQKIIPVILTIVSSVLGLIPFIWQGRMKCFWFAFASGAMGGLVFSMVALWIYLPLFLRFKPGESISVYCPIMYLRVFKMITNALVSLSTIACRVVNEKGLC
ncbi:MAG: efflux RND transporter permease subunit [Cyclobacteriaceae bacterium]|nr:efflux RND transporter permease subunit [Cyclobacteriaceae bacterium]